MGKKGRSSYTYDISERCKTNTDNYRYQLVRKLLKKLPESERTVITLYYLGKVPTEGIGRYLGVSANTIARRLQRAHKLLQEDEALLIQEVLGGAQISGNVKEKVMRQIPHIQLKSHSVRKRFFFTFLTILGLAIIVASVLQFLNIN
jgi:hypothetical protein